MLPFALLVLVFLLLLFNFVNGGWSGGSGADDTREQVVHCGQGADKIQVQKGDSCWEIGERYRVGVEGLLGIEGNEGVECETLVAGSWICVPA